MKSGPVDTGYGCGLAQAWSEPTIEPGIMPHVVYLTGAPASGKSTLSRVLAARVPDLAVFEYGAELTRYLSARDQTGVVQEDIRRQSSAIASASDIAAVDELLLEFVATSRRNLPVLIDTHAVTKERYGFRITAYSFDAIRKLQPTLIVMLYTAPSVAVDRIKANPGGRPNITEWEAGFHTTLQASVAVAFATAVDVPVYLLDATRSTEELAGEIQRLLERAPRDGATS